MSIVILPTKVNVEHIYNEVFNGDLDPKKINFLIDKITDAQWLFLFDNVPQVLSIVDEDMFIRTWVGREICNIYILMECIYSAGGKSTLAKLI